MSHFIVQALRGQSLSVYGDGTQTRGFCYVSDLLEDITRLMLADPEVGNPHENSLIDGSHGPVNLGNPAEMKVIDVAHLVLRLGS